MPRVKKRARGRLTKKEQRKKNMIDTRENLLDAVIKGDAKLVKSYQKCVDVLVAAVEGTLKGATPAQQVQSANAVKKYCDDLDEEYRASLEETFEEGETPSEGDKTVESSSLISYDFEKKEA